MLGSLLRAVVVIVVIVGAAAFLLGWWWGADGPRIGGEPAPVATTGVNSERAREVGAEVGERTATAANEARRALGDGTLTTKIKAKMALDDTVRALEVDIDTTDGIVTVSGVVASAAQKARVLQLARETEGVKNVVDRLTVK